MINYAEIIGWGKCLPPKFLTNHDLATFMDTTDEWISSRTGIKQRYISHVSTNELATLAAKRAIAAAGISPNQIDLIILATCSPDSIIPNTATFVQDAIGALNASAFDINSACTGFVYGLNIATSMIRFGSVKTALVIGAERLSWYIDWEQRDSAVLFGDGAGAVVLQATNQQLGVLSFAQLNNPEGKNSIRVDNFGTGMCRDKIQLGLEFQGRDVFKRAVPGMTDVSLKAIEEIQLGVADIDLIIPHQANLRIIEAVVKNLGADNCKTFINIANYGNTSAATIPIAIVDALEQGVIQSNQLILLPTFGAGLTSGASVLRWGEKLNPSNTIKEELPDCQKTALELIGY